MNDTRPYSDEELAEVRRRRGEELSRLFATIDELKKKLARWNNHDCHPRDGGDL